MQPQTNGVTGKIYKLWHKPFLLSTKYNKKSSLHIENKLTENDRAVRTNGGRGSEIDAV